MIQLAGDRVQLAGFLAPDLKGTLKAEFCNVWCCARAGSGAGACFTEVPFSFFLLAKNVQGVIRCTYTLHYEQYPVPDVILPYRTISLERSHHRGPVSLLFRPPPLVSAFPWYHPQTSPLILSYSSIPMSLTV